MATRCEAESVLLDLHIFAAMLYARVSVVSFGVIGEVILSI